MSVSYGGDSITFADSSVQSSGWTGFRNRIINGAMTINQRGSSSYSSPNTYTLDRFAFANTGGQTYTVQQSTNAPAGFYNSLLMTNTNSVSAGTTNYQILYQSIEGYNIADLNWGTANAKAVTVSFWVKSSVTGTYGCILRGGSSPTYYVSSYSIPVADTWTYITLTVPGCTTDTWGSTNALGLTIYFDLGVGSTYSGAVTGAWGAGNIFGLTGGTKFSATNGATFYITGVQLERGSTASSFEYRPYGTELQLCQRYFYKVDGTDGLSSVGAGMSISTTEGRIAVQYPVKMRASPTASYSGTIYILNTTGAGTTVTSIAANYGGAQGAMIGFGVASGMTVGAGNLLITASGASNYFQASAEL